MTKKQIENYIKFLKPRKPITVRIVPDKEVFPYAANIKRRKLCISKQYLRELIKYNDTEYLKSLLMHEVGHVNTPYYSSKSRREFEAENWAIQEALKRGWVRRAEYIKNRIRSWGKQQWNNDIEMRKYILAFKIAKKGGVI